MSPQVAKYIKAHVEINSALAKITIERQRKRGVTDKTQQRIDTLHKSIRMRLDRQRKAHPNIKKEEFNLYMKPHLLINWETFKKLHQ